MMIWNPPPEVQAAAQLLLQSVEGSPEELTCRSVVDRWRESLEPACWSWPADSLPEAVAAAGDTDGDDGVELEFADGVVRVLVWQAGQCAVCGIVSGPRYARVLDADPATGLVRGWLCWSCASAVHGSNSYYHDYRLLFDRYLRRPAAAVGELTVKDPGPTYAWWTTKPAGAPTPVVRSPVLDHRVATELFEQTFAAAAPLRSSHWPALWSALVEQINQRSGTASVSAKGLAATANERNPRRRPLGHNAVTTMLAWCQDNSLLAPLHALPDDPDTVTIYIVTNPVELAADQHQQ